MAIKISTTADMVNAIAGLLGFSARESVFSYMIAGDRVVFTSRQDIGNNYGNHAANVAAMHGITHALIVIISDTLDATAVENLEKDVTAAYTAHGITVERRIHTTTTDHGGQWTDLDTKETGLANDPTSSVAGLHSILSGGHPDQTDAQIIADIERTVDAYTRDDYARISASRALDNLKAIVNHTDSDLEPGELAKALATWSFMGGFRDAITRIALNDPAEASATLIELARHLRDEDRAHLLTAAAVGAYLSGSGGKTRMILEAARKSHDGRLPDMAYLIQQAHEAGLPPHLLAEVITKASKNG